MNDWLKELVTIASAIIALAIIATLVSKNANTSGVITAAFKGLGGAITAATGPVSGGFSLSGANGLNNNF